MKKMIALCISVILVLTSLCAVSAEDNAPAAMTDYQKQAAQMLHDFGILSATITDFDAGEFVSEADLDQAVGRMQGNEAYQSTLSRAKYVTVSQAAVELLDLLGRREVAEASIGKQNMAVDLGLLKGVQHGWDEYLTQADFVTMLERAIRIDVYKTSSMTDDGDLGMSAVKDGTILTENMDIYKGQGILYVVGNCSINGRDTLQQNRARIGEEVFVFENLALSELLGFEVEYYYRQRTNIDDKTILSIRATNHNTVYDIPADDILQTTTHKNVAFEDGSRTKEVAVGGDAYVLENYEFIQKAENVPDEKFQPVIGSVRLVDNNEDGRIDVVFLNHAQIGKVTAINTLLESFYVSVIEKNYVINEDMTLEILKNGQEIAYYSLRAEEDFVEVYESPSGKFVKVVVLTDIMGGVIQEVGDNSVTLFTALDNGEDAELTFPLSPALVMTNGSVLAAGAKGTFVANEAGSIVYYDNNVGSVYEYGFVVDMKQNGSFGEWMIKIFNSSNQFVIYTCDSDITVDGKTGQDGTQLRAALEQAATNGEVSSLIKYKANKQNKLKWVDTTLDNTQLDDPERLTYQKFTGLTFMGASMMLESNLTPQKVMLDTGVMVFKIPRDLKDEDNYIASGSSILQSQSTFHCYDMENELVTAILLDYYDPAAINIPNAVSEGLSIVLSDGEALNSEGELMRKVTVFKGTEEVSFFIDDGEKTKLFQQTDTTQTGGSNGDRYTEVPPLQPGDLIFYTVSNEVATAIKKLNMEPLGGDAKGFIQDVRTGSERAYGELIGWEGGILRMKIGLETPTAHFDEVIYSLRTGSPTVYIYNRQRNTVTITDKSALTLTDPGQKLFLRVNQGNIREIIIYE